MADPLAHLRDQPDERLWEQCRWEAFRASGPGGQKRNKTSSAVRVTHGPTGISAIANESRSQSQNRARAFKRLRHRLATEVRQPVDLEQSHPPTWFCALLLPESGRAAARAQAAASGQLRVSPGNERYLPAAGLVLDVLAAAGGSVSDAARWLGIGTANLVRFLENDEKLWAQVGQMRSAAGLRPLNSR